MPKLLLTAKDIESLKANQRNKKGELAPYGRPTGIANLRVWVSLKGTKSFQLRRDGKMLTLAGSPTTHSLRRWTSPPARRCRRTSPGSRAPFGQWIDHYAEVRRHKVSTRARAQSMRLVLRPLLRREIGALTSSWLEQRMAELAGSYKARTRRSYQSNIVMLVNFVLDEGGLQKSPFRRLASFVRCGATSSSLTSTTW